MLLAGNQDERLCCVSRTRLGAGAVISAVRPGASPPRGRRPGDRPKMVSTPTAGMV